MIPYICPLGREEARKRINVLCYFYPALLGNQCGENRLSKAAVLAANGFVSNYFPPIQYFVTSQRDNRHSYLVNTEDHTCECPDHRAGFICKHRLAVAAYTTAPDLVKKLEKDNPLEADEVYRGQLIPAQAY